MRVLFSTYSLAFQNPGGGEQVLLNLKCALETFGITVELFDPWNQDQWKRMDAFDLVHSFSCVEPSRWRFFKERLPKTPLLVTPTLWTGKSLGLIHQWRQRIAPTGVHYFQKFVDHWLPTTGSESQGLWKQFRIPESKRSVLRNGIAENYLSSANREFKPLIQQDYLLHVGRFHPVKRQRQLIEYFSDAPVHIVFVGGEDPQFRDYFEACKSAAKCSQRAQFTFLGKLDATDEDLLSAYRFAKALLLPSEFETFGLVALEALAAGCPRVLVTKNNGLHSEFDAWSPRVSQLDPMRLDLWKSKCLKIWSGEMLQEPSQRIIQTQIQMHYSWGKIAQELLGIYQNSRYT